MAVVRLVLAASTGAAKSERGPCRNGAGLGPRLDSLAAPGLRLGRQTGSAATARNAVGRDLQVHCACTADKISTDKKK